ncbi:hypothetical protein LAZ67_6001508 [Cordylochernes scorpioides]|uniref:Uncharacterized protein n=1 Tax=Cordylochernes scorpioides TaxID=51811 RepID=A0ABY6KMB5_9ARAC|nr:hypothetical protein LAZ67_6001508 [Cordylochernes scorpioides]
MDGSRLPSICLAHLWDISISSKQNIGLGKSITELLNNTGFSWLVGSTDFNILQRYIPLIIRKATDQSLQLDYREARLKATRERATTSRASETEQQREARLKATRERATTSRTSETEQQRAARLMAKQERATTSRASETEASETADQRGDRLSGFRDRATTSRASDHLFIKISLLRHKVWSGTFHKNEIHGANL